MIDYDEGNWLSAIADIAANTVILAFPVTIEKTEEQRRQAMRMRNVSDTGWKWAPVDERTNENHRWISTWTGTPGDRYFRTTRIAGRIMRSFWRPVDQAEMRNERYGNCNVMFTLMDNDVNHPEYEHC